MAKEKKEKSEKDNAKALPEFIGVDVGTAMTKVTRVSWDGNSPRLEEAFSFKTGANDLRTDDAAGRAALANTIKDALKGAKTKVTKTVIALPESTVFNRLLTFPKLSEGELDNAIHWNAKQFLPIPVDEVKMDWIQTAEIEQDGKQMVQLLVVAAPKRIIDQSLNIFNEAGLELIAIETEAVATSRAIANAYPVDAPILVVDIGSSGTDLSVLVKKKLIFSQSLATGSDAFDKALISQFKIDSAQAEQYKSKTGITQEGDGQIAATLAPVVKVILDELVKTINYFRTKYQQSTPQSVKLIGSGARMPGMPQYLSQGLGIPVELADLSQNLKMSKEVESEYGSASALVELGVALGLALKRE
ncbi:MAG: type IV pilus assembly protein PilM [Candidatus Dojkabacteria bacterium]